MVQIGPVTESNDWDATFQLLTEQRFANERDMVIFVRDWIYENSIEKIDDQFWFHWKHPKAALAALVNRSRGIGDGPHMECSARARMTRMVTKEFSDVLTRTVYLLTDKNLQLNSHTVFEHRNPETNSWEFHDALFNVHYERTADGKVLSALEMIDLPFDVFHPCRTNEKCGWDDRIDITRDYLSLIMIPRDLSKTRGMDVHIRKGGFDTEKIFEPIPGDRLHSGPNYVPATMLEILNGGWVERVGPIHLVWH